MTTLDERLVQEWAESLGEALTAQLIKQCQAKSPGTLSDSGLENLWEEVCVLFRQESTLSSLYRAQLIALLQLLFEKLGGLEKRALWRQTEDGHLCAERWGNTRANIACDERPINSQRVAEHVFEQHVLYECWNFENARIRTHLE